MTKTKKTLGRNWTRYHNWYGMNNVLEAACSGQLHWTRETIRQYTLDHAPEVNQGSTQRHASQPPPLPGNDDDDWFKCHPKVVARRLASQLRRRHQQGQQRAPLGAPRARN